MDIKKYTCNLCNKDYKTSQSLCNHKRIYHKNTLFIPQKNDINPLNYSNNPQNYSNNPQNNTEYINSKEITNTLCEYCKKEYSRLDNLKRHLKICKKKEYIIKENEELKKEIEEIEKKLLDVMNYKYKMHPKTLQKMINNNTNTHTNSHNNITINNNNIKYIELGNEELHNVFSVEEVMNILQKGGGALDEIIVYTHLNDKYPQFQNIIIPNIRSKHAYMYCDQLDKYILCNKTELLENMIDYRFDDLKGFYEQYGHKLKPEFRKNIERILPYQSNDKYCKNKSNEMNIVFYNQCNKDNIKYKPIENQDILDD
jgi:hypothetical protein